MLSRGLLFNPAGRTLDYRAIPEQHHAKAVKHRIARLNGLVPSIQTVISVTQRLAHKVVPSAFRWTPLTFPGILRLSKPVAPMTKPSPNDAKSIVKDPKSPISTIAEAHKVQDRVAIGAKVVYEAVRLEGEDELERPAVALAWSGLAAGLSMGFSLLAEAVLHAYLPASQWRPLLQGMGYSIGFLIVILGRQQLFTENTLTVILPLLVHKNSSTMKKVARLWSVVLVSNILGTFLFALVVARLHFLAPAVQQGLLEVCLPHVAAGFWVMLLRAVFAGWLIALMVWMLPDAASSRVVIIIILTYLIAVASLSHIIAGSTDVFYLVIVGKLSLGRYFTIFFFPTLIGNIAGGVSLVAALAHAQVVGGKK